MFVHLSTSPRSGVSLYVRCRSQSRFAAASCLPDEAFEHNDVRLAVRFEDLLATKVKRPLSNGILTVEHEAE
eukprot:6192318-Pleurochrysis_carterae.AAC.1